VKSHRIIRIHGELPARIDLRLPVIVMVLAATAVPVELRAPGLAAWSFGVYPADVLANVLGYLPVGLVLASLGRLRVVVVAGLLSLLAETLQLGMAHRDPSVIDIVANVAGAALGVLGSQRYLRLPLPAVGKRTSSIGVLLAVILVAGVWMTSANPVNNRGASSPGLLEAHWKLDEPSGTIAEDSSGHGLNGRFGQPPRRVSGITGPAVLLQFPDDFIDFGHPGELRLVGSMTVSTWVKPVSFSVDDVTIVSSRNDGGTQSGYQLDIRVHNGARTMAFSIADECGGLTVRDGATPLATGAWYNLAGVYDAEARTLDVYLNGRLDNGALRGQVTGAQRSSRADVYIGSRRHLEDSRFTGIVDNLRIYSRSLTQPEIVSDMRGHQIEERTGEGAMEADGLVGTESAVERHLGSVREVQPHTAPSAACAVVSDWEDDELPIAVAGLGLLLSVICLGFWPTAGRPLCIVVSLIGGFLLLPLASSSLPPINLLLFPLTSLAGGLSVMMGLHVHRPS
jgi:VanZ family protein